MEISSHRSDGVPRRLSPSGNVITECSSVLIDWNEVIYPLLTKCVIYANESLCWLICFNSCIHCSNSNVYCSAVFSISHDETINFNLIRERKWEVIKFYDIDTWGFLCTWKSLQLWFCRIAMVNFLRSPCKSDAPWVIWTPNLSMNATLPYLLLRIHQRIPLTPDMVTPQQHGVSLWISFALDQQHTHWSGELCSSQADGFLHLWPPCTDLAHTKAILSHQGSRRPGFAPPWDLISGTTSKQTHYQELLLFQLLRKNAPTIL